MLHGRIIHQDINHGIGLSEALQSADVHHIRLLRNNRRQCRTHLRQFGRITPRDDNSIVIVSEPACERKTNAGGAAGNKYGILRRLHDLLLVLLSANSRVDCLF